jgi:hypothetical protein
MSFRVAALLAVSGLVACSHNTAVAVRAASHPEQRAEASEAAAEPIALENALRQPSAPEPAPAASPADDTRPNRREREQSPSGEQTSDDANLDERRRIRQAAMADGSL